MSIPQTLGFDIDGMTCGACVGRAEKAMASVAGVARAEANLATHTGRVVLTLGADAAVVKGVIGALSAAGYPAIPVRQKFDIDGMTCAACQGRVEKAIRALPDVVQVHVNLLDGSAVVTRLNTDPAPVLAAVATAGYVARELASGAPRRDRAAVDEQALKARLWIAAILTLPVFVLEMGGHLYPPLHHLIARTIGTQTSWVIQFLLTLAVLAGPGLGFFRIGLPALAKGAPDMNSLVALGTLSAFGFSTVATFFPSLLPIGTRAVYFEAAAVIVTLILLGRLLEARAKGRAGAAIKKLIALRPATALVERDKAQVEIPVEDIRRGDILHIRPGERIAVDGLVREGESWVDESMITGEPAPVAKARGAALVAGTVNGNGALRMRATAVGGETLLARIVAMVEEAQGARLPVQDLVNTITGWFVPAILAIAVLTVAVWLVFGPDPGLPYALVAGVSVLIIACPCAMGLATPTSVMVGTGRAAELGVLFRQGDALQALQSVRMVAFDKTGTLTMGRPDLAAVLPNPGWTDDSLLTLAASVEALSEHPVGGAVVRGAKALALALLPVSGMQALPGRGLIATVGGQTVLVGNARLMDEQAVRFGPLPDLPPGSTPVLVAVDGVAAGVLAVADRIKPSAKATIAALRQMGLEVAMVTGDTAGAAAGVAAELGITDVRAGVLPEGKRDAIRNWQKRGPVAFVGDGINDAPVLAAADVGIAIGTGTDVAVESAQVVLMSGDPSGVATAIRISRHTMANIRQNLFWAFGYNVVLIPVAAGALYPVFGVLLSPALAAGAMALSSVLVVSNALRLRWVARG